MQWMLCASSNWVKSFKRPQNVFCPMSRTKTQEIKITTSNTGFCFEMHHWFYKSNFCKLDPCTILSDPLQLRCTLITLSSTTAAGLKRMHQRPLCSFTLAVFTLTSVGSLKKQTHHKLWKIQPLEANEKWAETEKYSTLRHMENRCKLVKNTAPWGTWKIGANCEKYSTLRHMENRRKLVKNTAPWGTWKIGANWKIQHLEAHQT